MNPARKGLVAVAMLGSVVAGGAAGVALFGPSSATAQTTTTTPANSSGSTSTTAPANSTFHSNETPSHEAAETPSQETAENSGQGHCAHSGTTNR